MSEQQETARVTEAAARAAEGTPGVTRLAVRARYSGVGHDGRPGRHLQLHLAVREGHRALDVARAVREAVREAVRAATGPHPVPVSVAVTVTDIV